MDVETSNRASTNDRAKVRHKVRETKKKKVKAAKKNPQWKSSEFFSSFFYIYLEQWDEFISYVHIGKPKDPGIPNEFPYKDQILAEVAEERRRVCLTHVLVVQQADCALTFE